MIAKVSPSCSKPANGMVRPRGSDKSAGGITLIEVVVATVVIAVASIGALSYHYLAVKQLVVAKAELAAARVGQMLLEDWKGTGGLEVDIYDPTSLSMGFVRPTSEDWANYMTVVDGMTFYLSLDKKDLDTDDFSGTVLRQIMVSIRWHLNPYSQSGQEFYPPLDMTTYVRSGQD